MARYFKYDPASGEASRLGIADAVVLARSNQTCDPAKPFVVMAEGRLGAEGIGSWWQDRHAGEAGGENLEIAATQAEDGLPWSFVQERSEQTRAKFLGPGVPILPTVALPWIPISTLTPQPGDAPVLVCSGDDILFARWRHGWSPGGAVDTSGRVWTGMEDTIALDPQPELYLPLTLPDGRPWPVRQA